MTFGVVWFFVLFFLMCHYLFQTSVGDGREVLSYCSV